MCVHVKHTSITSVPSNETRIANFNRIDSEFDQSTCDLTTVNEKLTSLQLQPRFTCNTTEGKYAINYLVYSLLLHKLYRNH